MARSGYRSNDRQLTVFVSVALHARLREAADAAGGSLQEFVESVLRERVNGGVGDRPVDYGGVEAQGGGVGAQRGGNRGSDSVSGVAGRRVDWDQILAAGAKPKPVPVQVVGDPLEDIA